MIFVGVHCRKTDYDARLRALGGCIVDHRFYDAALDIYRRRYNDEENKVIFLAVSDNPGWIKVSWRSRPLNVKINAFSSEKSWSQC